MATRTDEFNPEQPQRQPQDWTSASRGWQPAPARGSTLARAAQNQATGELLTNAGRLFSTAVQTADQLIEMDIKETVGEYVEPIRQEQTYLRSLEKARLDPNTPQEIRDVLNKSERLTAARNAGKLSDTHYWAQLDILSRQLRSRYPTYRDTIDSNFAQITGNIPANALKNSLENEIAAFTKAGDSDEEKIDWLFKNKGGLLPPDALTLRETMPLPALRRHLESEVLFKERAIADLQMKERQFTNAKAENDFNKLKAFELAKTRLDFLRTNKMQSIDNQLGASWKEFSTGVKDQFGRSVAAGTWNEAELAQLTAKYGEFKVAYNEEFDAAITDLKDIMDPQQIADLRTEHGEMLKVYEDALFNKDTGILQWAKTYNENVKQATLSRLLQDQTFKTMLGVKDNLGPEGWNAMMLRDPDILNPFHQLVKDLLKMSPHDPNSPPVGKVMGDVSSQVSDPKVWVGATAEWQHTLENLADYTPTQQATVVQKLFGPGNENIVNGMDPNTRGKFYTALINEETVAAVVEQSAKNPKLLETFSNWGFRSFTQIMKPEMDAAREITLNRRYVTLTFNPETAQFSLVKYEPKPGEMVPESPFGKYTEPFRNDEAQQTVDRINTALRGLKPLMEANGANLGQEMSNILPLFGLNTEGAPLARNKEGPMLDNLNYMIGKAILEGPGNVIGAVTGALESTVRSKVENDPEVKALMEAGKAIVNTIGGFIGEAGAATRPESELNQAALQGRGSPSLNTRRATSETPATGLHAFISDAEGTGAGSQGYSQVFAKSRVQPEKPVETMTLNEVLDWQNQSKKAGSASTAAGRYQIVNKTLKGLMKNMKLTGDEVFSPALQDRMALELMKARGLEKFKSGKMSAEQFAFNLSKEWASLPNPKTGKSYYDSNLNKSRVSLDEFLSQIERLR